MVYESNSIEGNSLTLRETELVLSKGVTVSGKPLKDHLEAVNLAQAWAKVKQLAGPHAVLTESDLLDLHRIVLTRVEDSFAGCYRTGAVRIAGSNHLPPNPVKVPDFDGRAVRVKSKPSPIPANAPHASITASPASIRLPMATAAPPASR